MAGVTRQIRRRFVLTATLLCSLTGVAAAQTGPVAKMYASDQKRDASKGRSFLIVPLPAKNGVPSAQVYLSAGDLERAFDSPDFRPDGVIIPTNTELDLAANDPATQRVLVSRVQKQTGLMRDLEAQVAARRKQPMQIALDSFVVKLPQNASLSAGGEALPKVACLIATDFAKGGAIDQRALFAQDRIRKGIASCLAALDAAGGRSVTLPLLGAASSTAQTNDPRFEGQRVLKECRLINSVAGIALGIHDFAASRRNVREIGVVQWDQEVTGMFEVPAGSSSAQAAQNAYRDYAEQIQQAFRKGLAGEKTTASDVAGTCSAIFNAQ